MGQSKNVKKPVSQVEKLDLRFLYNKTETSLASVTNLILRFAITQNKIQQINKTKINHINDNHIKFELSLHFGGIWPTTVLALRKGHYWKNSTVGHLGSTN